MRNSLSDYQTLDSTSMDIFPELRDKFINGFLEGRYKNPIAGTPILMWAEKNKDIQLRKKVESYIRKGIYNQASNIVRSEWVNKTSSWFNCSFKPALDYASGFGLSKHQIFFLFMGSASGNFNLDNYRVNLDKDTEAGRYLSYGISPRNIYNFCYDAASFEINRKLGDKAGGLYPSPCDFWSGIQDIIENNTLVRLAKNKLIVLNADTMSRLITDNMQFSISSTIKALLTLPNKFMLQVNIITRSIGGKDMDSDLLDTARNIISPFKSYVKLLPQVINSSSRSTTDMSYIYIVRKAA